MIFSVFFLVWNLLVAVVLVSVARTQTINIRKFLRELEHDALLLDGRLRTTYGKTPWHPLLCHHICLSRREETNEGGSEEPGLGG